MDDLIIKTMENLMQNLKLNKSELSKYETIICNGRLEHHYNLCTLIKKTEELKSKIEDNVENQMNRNLIRSKYAKALLLHDIEKLLGVETLDIDSKKHQNKFDKIRN